MSVGLFIAVCVWIALDGLLPPAARTVQFNVAVLFRNLPGRSYDNLPDGSAERVKFVIALYLTIAAALAGLLASLVFGSRGQRGIRSWLAFTALVAAWLALSSGWPELAWHGQQWRVGRQLDAFIPVADDLRANWPKADGDHPDFGPFLAYPRGAPTTLMFLSPPQQQSAPLPIASTTRSPNGAVRFELAAPELEAWLEWRPPRSAPESFKSGLNSSHALVRSTPLKDGWFLTRYAER